ncbi:MAG: hypothetical protein ACOCVZ_05220, partial [Gemmatimonadota bacterium]
MSDATDFHDIIRATTGRAGLRALVAALGLDPLFEPVPRAAWSAYGLPDPSDIRAVVVTGRAGSLDALLLEMGPGAGPDRAAWLARRIRARNPARLHLFLFAAPEYRRVTLAAFGLDDALHHLTLEPGRVRPSDVAALEEMAPRNGERGLELGLRHARALDRSRVTRRFFHDFRLRRAALAESWLGVPADAERERAQLALLLLSRLTFLYFLQRRGVLAGDERYLPSLFGRWEAEREPETSFYRSRLVPLFFGALNRRPEDRDPAARALGALPYLNGGLFDRHGLERRYPGLDLPDVEVGACFDQLLERYRFTDREAADAGHGVDPEVLGRVFEGLMAPGQREATGSFYTPAPVVGRVVGEAVATYLADTCAPEEA